MKPEDEKFYEGTIKMLEESIEFLRQRLKRLKQDTLDSAQDEDKNQEPTTPESSDSEQWDLISTYKKNPEITDDDMESVVTMYASHALNFLLNNEVQDFEMTSKNEDDGIFDGMGFKVWFADGGSTKCVFKFVYEKDEGFRLFLDVNSEGDNSIRTLEGHVKQISRMNLDEDTIYILSSTSSMDMTRNILPTEGVRLEQCDHIESADFMVHTKEGCENAIFEVKSELLKHKFYLLTSQMEPAEMVKESLRNLPQGDIYPDFESYMKHWSQGNYVLTKHDVAAKIAQLALSPYLKTLTDDKCNEKSENLKRAIMDFPVTIVEDPDEDIVENIWKIEESWIDEDFRKVRDKYGLRDEEMNLILWYLGKLPLVVRVDGSNEKLIKRVMNLLGKSTRNKKIVLTGQVSRNDFEMGDTLGSLSDVVKKCGKKEYYSNILQSFRVSLQGRGCLKLKYLVTHYADLANFIGTTELLKMSQREYLIVGNQKDEPDLYIARTVSPVLVKIKDILHACRSSSDALIIVLCDQQSADRLFSSEFTVMPTLYRYINCNYLTDLGVTNLILLSKRIQCTTFEFEAICEKSGKPNVYLFRHFDDKNCILMLRKGNKLKVGDGDALTPVKENEILKHYANPLHVLCAPPGMGKSTLMKSLYNNCPSHYLAVYVNLIDHDSFLAEEPDFERILARFLRIDGTEDDLFDQFKMRFWENRTLYMFLDGLDEVNGKCVKHLLNFVRHVSSEGGKIWLSSRENLREEICRMFHVVPVDIKELDEDEQMKFFKSKLERSYEDDQIEKFATAIFKSTDLSSCQKLLGIPLQLHMITQMFVHDDQAGKKLQNENCFLLIKMFELFFEGKIKFVLNKLVSKKEEHRFGDVKHVLGAYEILALKTCLDSEDFNKLPINEKEVEDFSETIKREGDPFGIIKRIGEDGRAVFHHQTYAEYFAFAFFKKDPNNVVLLQDEIFDARYENFRKLLDVMWADNNLHLAIICEDLNRLEQLVGSESKDEEMLEKRRILSDSTDAAGRTAFHLAFSYGHRYPPFLEPNYLSSGDWKTQKRKTPEIIERLLPVSTYIAYETDIFDFDCTDYALKSRCLYSLDILMEGNQLTFDELKESLEDIDPGTLACCCAQFGYPNLLQALIQRDPKLRDTQKDLLQLAILGCEADVCTPPRNGNVQCVELLLRKGVRLNCTQEFILNEISMRNCSDMLKILVDYTMSYSLEFPNFEKLDFCSYRPYCDELVRLVQKLGNSVNSRNHLGQTLLHKACKFRNSEVLKELFSNESLDVDVQDHNGVTPLHLACQQGVLHSEMFLRLGANINLTDNGKNNALHHASMSVFCNSHIIPGLIDGGLNIDAQNEQGQTALHLACERSNFDNMKVLLERGANPRLEDNRKNNALHYVSMQERANEGLVYLLLDENMVVTKKQTCSYFKESPSYRDFERFLDRVASLKIANTGGSNTLHYAVTSKFDATDVIDIIIRRGVSVDGQNEQGQTPLHLVCGRYNYYNMTLLLRHGANPEIGDNRKNTALHYLSRQREDMSYSMKSLINRNNKTLNKQNLDGQTPLHVACKEGHHRNVEMLLEKLADFTIEDDEGNSALHYAAMSKDPKTLQLVLKKEQDICKKNKNGQILLHVACKEGRFENVKFLLTQMEDIFVTDHNGNNALHCAAMGPEFNKDLFDLLITKGFNLKEENNEGFIPLRVAFKEMNGAACKYFLQRRGQHNTE